MHGKRTRKRTATEWICRGASCQFILSGSIPLLEATLQLQPDDVESLTQLGMVKSDLGELVEARRLLERAVALDPAHVNALVSLGVAALRAGDITSAQSPLEQALAQALMALDTPEHRQEPDTCLTRALALGPPSANCSELSPEAAGIWPGTSLRALGYPPTRVFNTVFNIGRISW